MDVLKLSELAGFGEEIQVENVEGKVICKRFDANKHKDIGTLKVVSFRAAIKAHCGGAYATPYIRVTVEVER